MTYRNTKNKTKKEKSKLMSVSIIDGGGRSSVSGETQKTFRCLVSAFTKTGRRVGWVVGAIKGCLLEVPILVIEKDFQGQGIGGELLKKIVEAAGRQLILATFVRTGTPANELLAYSNYGHDLRRSIEENTALFEQCRTVPLKLYFLLEQLNGS